MGNTYDIFYFHHEGGEWLLSKFNFTIGAWRTKVLAIFLSFCTLGWFLSLAILTYKLTPFIIAILFFINGLLYLIFKLQLEPKEIESSIAEKGEAVLEEPSYALFFSLIYIALLIYGFFLLHSGITGASISSLGKPSIQIYLYILSFHAYFGFADIFQIKNQYSNIFYNSSISSFAQLFALDP